MPKRKVYISSTYRDLKDFRTVLIDFFQNQGARHFELSKIMERMYDEGKHEAFLDTCLREVDNSDIYLIILLQSAGSFPPQSPNLTYTQHEFERALKRIESNPDFKIFGYVYTGFEEDKCDYPVNYKALKSKFEGFPVSEFADIKDFKIQYLENFFSITDSNDNYILKRTPDQVISTLDRQVQRTLFIEQIATHKGDQTLFVHYQSQIDDAAHELNFRLSNVELTSNTLSYENQTFIRPNSDNLSFDFEESRLTTMLILMIAEKLNLKAKPTTIPELVTAFLEKESGYIFIPFLIQHSVETTADKERMQFLNNFFASFSDPSLQAILGFRKIIIIINFQRDKDLAEIDKPKRAEIYQTMTVLSGTNYIGNLSKIKLTDIETWIMEKVENNYETAHGYLKKYFTEEESRPMSKALAELQKAEDIIKNITNKNNS